MKPEWVDEIEAMCRRSGTAFFFQHGAVRQEGGGRVLNGKLTMRCGRTDLITLFLRMSSMIFGATGFCDAKKKIIDDRVHAVFIGMRSGTY